ncbi:hypothetical protein ES332_A13G217100v1 [Gossypium tomentosum]|uniref:Uncharacterized protein n=1 Tax=Gossypium tomentosum TaxID=34277 RepID=A0A5D2MN61_GOSTO|nr:hypothetical protein ES332_A13G217100v1 [Gossypium tomentosum]
MKTNDIMNGCKSDFDHGNDTDYFNEPLLLRPSYARSTSLLCDELRSFRISLRWCALDHSSSTGKFVSYLTFILLAVFVPIISSLPVWFQDLSIAFPTENTAFNLLVQFPESALAFLGFFTLPYVSSGFPLNSIAFVLVLGSWVYRTGVFLLVCVLFRLTCELQILRFQGLHKMFEGCGSDGGDIFQEHVRIRKQLAITSHRYRFFIIASLVVITASQFAALLMVLASKSDKNFFNSGDLLVCSTVQLSGFFLCLLGAARITHRAQGMAAVASRWHMSMTCAMAGVEQGKQEDDGFLPVSTCNETDSDDSSDMFISFSAQHPSNFQTRQALVSYLQHNNKGITLFGYALDRGLLHTLFAFEFSLVMWILSKVVVLND